MKFSTVPNETWLNRNYWELFLGALCFEFFMVQIVFPKEKIEFTLYDNKQLQYTYIKNKNIISSTKIKQIDYWWNYNNSYKNKKALNHYSKPQDGSFSGGPPAVGIYIYVKLITEQDNELLLVEYLSHFKSRPQWKYKLENIDDFHERYNCFHLRRLIKRIANMDLQ